MFRIRRINTFKNEILSKIEYYEMFSKKTIAKFDFETEEFSIANYNDKNKPVYFRNNNGTKQIEYTHKFLTKTITDGKIYTYYRYDRFNNQLEEMIVKNKEDNSVISTHIVYDSLNRPVSKSKLNFKTGYLETIWTKKYKSNSVITKCDRDIETKKYDNNNRIKSIKNKDIDIVYFYEELPDGKIKISDNNSDCYKIVNVKDFSIIFEEYISGNEIINYEYKPHIINKFINHMIRNAKTFFPNKRLGAERVIHENGLRTIDTYRYKETMMPELSSFQHANRSFINEILVGNVKGITYLL